MSYSVRKNPLTAICIDIVKIMILYDSLLDEFLGD